jgi:thiamine-monophosphate kinase
MIDLSDGLASDAAHLARASGVQLCVELERLPLEEGVEEICADLGVPTWQLAAGAGEDYELCFCAPAERRGEIESALARVSDSPISWIGEVTSGPPGVSLLTERGDQARLAGFEHRWQ